MKHIFILAVLALTSTTIIAQEKELTEAQKTQIETQLEVYFEKLDLSEEQKPKFKEITKKYALQMKTLKSSNKPKFAKYKEFKSIINFKNKEMKAILSNEQYKIYEETQEQMRRKMKEKRNNK